MLITFSFIDKKKRISSFVVLHTLIRDKNTVKNFPPFDKSILVSINYFVKDQLSYPIGKDPGNYLVWGDIKLVGRNS